MTLDKYKDKWKDIAEKLAYVSFTGPAYEILSSRNLTYEDIEKFNVTIFAALYVKEETKKDMETLSIRFSVFLQNKEEITFLLHNNILTEALISQVYNKEFGVFQHYTFEFPKPNALELYDAEYYLMELLHLESL